MSSDADIREILLLIREQQQVLNKMYNMVFSGIEEIGKSIEEIKHKEIKHPQNKST